MIIDDGDSWILELRETGIGEWYWDAEASTIAFKQAEHEIITVKASIDNGKLVLSPVDRLYANELRLTKEE